MGEVWEARDESLRRPVAVKVVSVLAGGGSRAEEARARFLREARITAALQHPNIVTVHDLGEATTDEGTTPFLVMELLRGRGLDAVVRDGPVDGPDVARWGAGVCDALAEAHGAGILHRDIKPANVFVTTPGAVKVLDFGIARAADPSATGDRLTHTGFLVGTASSMAPEQARGHPEQRSDLYALGCLLFELLTGRLPFTAPDTVGFLTAHLHDAPPAPSGVAPGVSPAWDRVVLRLLAKDPGERYASAAALADELRHLDASAPQRASHRAPTAPTPAPTVTAAVSPTAAATVTAAPTRSGPTRRGLLLGGAGIATLAVAGGSAALYVTGDPGKGPVAWSRNIGDVDLLNTGGPDVVLADGRCHVAGGHGWKETAVLHTLDQAGGEPLWSAPLDAAWAGEPRFAVVDGTVLTLSRGPDEVGYAVHVFDAATGEPLLRRQVEINTTRLDVSRPSGLLITEEDGMVSGTDPRTGDLRWAVDVSSPYGSAFLLAGDLVLSDWGKAVHGETGEELWEREDFSPMGDGGLVLGEGLLCYEAGETAAVDLVFRETRTGDVVWRSPFQESEPESVVGAFPPLGSLVSGTTVFLPSPVGDRRSATALDALTGEPKWTHDGAGPSDGEAASVADGFVLSTREGTVCLAADDGAERWRDEAGDTGAVRVSGPYALLYRTRGTRLFRRWTRVRILGADDGGEIWSGEFDSVHVGDPASRGEGDPVVVVDNTGTVWALRP
ncbi:hypothetical protein GCM10022245_66950 [Streptomyces mayteni]